MDIRLKRIVIFTVFLIGLFLLTFTSAFQSSILYPSVYEENTSFDGLHFDQPINVNNLSVVRSLEEDNQKYLFKYDVSFQYTGENSDLRVLNTPVRQIFLPEGVSPSRSNATLENGVKTMSDLVVQGGELNSYYKMNPNFQYEAKSEMRIPLSEDVGEYKFTIYTEPRELFYRRDDKMADVGVFFTNGKINSFTDNLGISDQGIRPITNTKEQGGYYANSLEVIHDSVLKSAENEARIATGIFVVSVALVILSILINKKNLHLLVLIGILLSILSLPRAMGLGPSNLGIFLIMPILAFIGYLVFRLITKPRPQLNGNDFKQAGVLFVLFILIDTLLFVVPRGM